MQFKDTGEIIFDVKEIRNKSLQMFHDVTELLEEHNIRYWLDFGTLLGAVREGRTIPYDGDFDISTIDDGNLVGRDEIWDALRRKGYQVTILFNNIKIADENSFASGKVDLHRYRRTGRGSILYQYGYSYNSVLLKKIVMLRKMFDIHRSNEKTFYPLGPILQAISERTKMYREIEELTSIVFAKGKYNKRFSFRLTHQDFEIINEPEVNRSKWGFVEQLPSWLVNGIYSILAAFLRLFKTSPLVNVEHSLDYFENLEKVTFHDIPYNSPNPHEQF